MLPPTINRQTAIEQFEQLLQLDCSFRVLRLLGEAKQGKTHLVAKVFQELARANQARCAVLDLRQQIQGLADILHIACSLLGGETLFTHYHAAHQEWINRPRLEVSGLQALFSKVSVRSAEEADETGKMNRHLTTQFVADLRRLDDRPLLLLFDQFDNAGGNVQSWLMNMLLAQLAPLAHVRVVVAGRTIPEASGSYATLCCSYQLLPVQEEQAYIDYCHRIKSPLNEDQIRALALALDHKPGEFASAMSKFSSWGGANV